MKKVITLEIGNSSWWKNKKYRKEASQELKKLETLNGCHSFQIVTDGLAKDNMNSF